MAFMMVLTLLLVTMFFAVAFDAGLWFFDHRTAQNQAEAASLAAVQHLPATDTTAATAAANEWLTKNGSGPGDLSCLVYSDRNGDGSIETVQACVGRGSPGIFSALSGVSVVHISASATATTGPASIANVVPWAVIPPDPDCSEGEICSYDEDGDGDYTDPGDCLADFDVCPWGLNPDNLYSFKTGGGGNTGIIDACGNGADEYRECIEGENVSGFFESGEEVVVGLQGGNLGINTANALGNPPDGRYAYESPTWYCDAASTPENLSGYDPDGLQSITGPGGPLTVNPDECGFRVVLVPILYSLPPQGGGSDALTVLGVAKFYIASWNRVDNKDAHGTATEACSRSVDDDDGANFACGMVWGYLITDEDILAPGFLLDQIGDTANPFAPLLIALVE